LHRSLKRNLVIGGAVLVVAAFAGGAYAATQNSGANTRQAFLNDVAKRLHVSPQQLSSALNGAYLDQLQAEVKAGRLSQAQANALKQRLSGSAAVPFGLLGPGPRAFHLFPGVPRPLPGAPGGLPGPGRFGGLGLFGAVAGAASYLGLTNQQLVQQLSSGKSLAQIATSKGKSVSGLEQAITAAVKTRLDKLAAAKLITAAQEQRILKRVNARVSAQVNEKGLRFRRVFPPSVPIPNYGVPAPPNSSTPPFKAPAPVHPALPLPAGPLPSA